jgi:hypothetical protein
MIPLDHFSDSMSREQSDSGGQDVGPEKTIKELRKSSREFLETVTK